MTSESGWIVGGCFFLAMGTLNILFYRKTGQDFFAKTQSGRPFVANFWARGGEKGVQFLFLGLGIILAFAGCVLIVVSLA
jgi:thiol:disulfide interchange protein